MGRLRKADYGPPALDALIESVRRRIPEAFTMEPGMPPGGGFTLSPVVPAVVWTDDGVNPDADLDQIVDEIREQVQPEIEGLDDTLHGGWEVIAWYATFHCASWEDVWGIYVREDRLYALAFRVLDRVLQALHSTADPASDFTCVATALWNGLIAHEQFHFLVDVFALTAEDRCGTPAYVPYARDVYKATFPGEECVEESLATVQQLENTTIRDNSQSGWLTGATRAAMAEFSKRLPRAYANYGEYLFPPSYFAGRDKLCSQVAEGKIAPICRPYRFPARRNAGDPSRVPVYLVRPVKVVPAADGLLYVLPTVDRLVAVAMEQLGANVRDGSKHSQALVLPGGRLVPLSTNWSDNRVPHFVVRQVADAAGVPRSVLKKMLMRN